MKILCLHGKGTSGSIFESQTSSIRSRLRDLNITYDFLDGPFTCPPAPGIDLFYPPPYYTHWEEDTPTAIRAARTRLLSHIAKNGPYDALLCFSQGCALAASTLLLHAHESPSTPLAIKSAIFICGGPPLPILEEIGYNIPLEVREADLASRAALAAQATSSAILEKGSARWGGEWTGGQTEEEIRVGIDGPVKIGVPTVHVYGAKDPRYVAGVLLSGVCGGDVRRTFDHGGGHEIPRGEVVTGRMAGLVRWALEEGGVIDWLID